MNTSLHATEGHASIQAPGDHDALAVVGLLRADYSSAVYMLFSFIITLLVGFNPATAGAESIIRDGSRVYIIGDRLAVDMSNQPGLITAVRSAGGEIHSWGIDGNEAASVELPGEVDADDLVVLCVGMVDSLRGDPYLEQFRLRLDAIIDGLPPGQVVLVTPVPRETEPGDDPIDASNHAVVVGRYANAVAEVARARSCLLVDLHGPLSRVQARLETGGLLRDGIHLDQNGWRLAEGELLWQLGLVDQDPDLDPARFVPPKGEPLNPPSREVDLLRGEVQLDSLPSTAIGLPPAHATRLAPSWIEVTAQLHEIATADQVDARALRNVMFMLAASPDRASEAYSLFLPYTAEDQPEGVRLAALAAIDDLPPGTVAGPPGIQTVRISVVPVKMTYDPARFEVSSGQPVRIILSNPDAQPHNLLVCMPGSLRAVGRAAEAMGTTVEAKARDWVPDSSKVLHAMPMVQLGQQGELRFMAPQRPGRYPIICTYPGHWQMMNGVMTVRRSSN